MNENNKSAYATFAGGCFWCMEPPYDKLNGVISTVVGYTGGHKVNPTYEEVSAGETGHTEAIQIEYDPSVITFQELLDVFWQNIDPTVQNRQFCDVGSQYRSEIFYHDEKQKKTAELSKRKIEENTQIEKVYTQISPFEKFYPAEEYHQKYSIKNPIRYRFYRYTCGRDQRLRDVWGK
ncbi:MAG: peptide-methionine (S)-S-oxide reductase MsrA [Chlamydiota bacterium]|nr:peptide-methionine (S)-S-oxide reductase MsrA [Chlamydiota bacterium]